MFDLAKDFRSILPKLSDRDLQHVLEHLQSMNSPAVNSMVQDILTERARRISSNYKVIKHTTGGI